MADAEKTEEATAKRKSESFEKGNFAKSQEIGTLLIVSAAFAVLTFIAKDAAMDVGRRTATIFQNIGTVTFTEEGIIDFLRSQIDFMVGILLPFMGAVTAAGILAGGLQSGFKPTPKALSPDLKKLDPIKGMQKLFDKQKLVQFGVDLLKFLFMFGILYGLVRQIMEDPIFSSPVPVNYVGEFIFELILTLLSRLILVMTIIAAIDYFWQRHKTAEDMKMTKQEVKDEQKQSMGDPQMRSAQRRQAMNILRQSMGKAAGTADVMVTNPTHFAVALKYEQGRDRAPVIVAKGEGRYARKLKEIARENGVPMVENKVVARILFRVGEVNKTIPVELYEVVAQILAHVYKTHRYYFHRLRARRLAAEGESNPTAA